MSLNEDLQQALQDEFSPRGIVAYSCCCRWGCTGSYDEDDDEDFKVRESDGIYYIRLHLDGMNYNDKPTSCYASYGNFEYLMDHWEEECAIIAKWCEIVGLQPSEYVIEKPEHGRRGVGILFGKPLDLEEQPEESEEEDSEDEAEKADEVDSEKEDEVEKQ